MCRRTMGIALLLGVLGAGWLVSPAAAGGGNWMEWRTLDGSRAWDMVAGRTYELRATVFLSTRAAARRILRSKAVVYIDPRGRWTEDGYRVSRRARPVGEVAPTPVDDSPKMVLLTARVRLPRLSPGIYHSLICSSECPSLGIDPTEINIHATAFEAAAAPGLRELRYSLTARVDRVRNRLRHALSVQRGELQGVLQSRIDSAVDEIAESTAPPSDGAALTNGAWFTGGAVVVLLASFLTTRQARRQARGQARGQDEPEPLSIAAPSVDQGVVAEQVLVHAGGVDDERWRRPE